MKKVKTMMVSLILFAVVGGALAFKAKTSSSFCTAAASYYDPAGTENDKYFCRFNSGTQIPAGVINVTLNCTATADNSVPIDALPTLQVHCTTIPPVNVDTDTECATIKCPNTTLLVIGTP